MAQSQRKDERNDAQERRVTLNLVVEGDSESVDSIKKQIVHYAQALPGVRVE